VVPLPFGCTPRSVLYEHERQRLRNGEAAVVHHVRQPTAEADRDAEERRKADHAGDHAFREHLEDKGERIALAVARDAGRERLFRPFDAETREHVERFLAAAVRCQEPRRLRQREAENPDDQRTYSDHDPYAAPSDHIAEEKRGQRGNRPNAGSADEVDESKDTAADRLGRIFAGIGEGERLFAAEAEAGHKTRGNQPPYRRRQGAKDREYAEDQKVELVNRLAAPPVAEFALTDGADEHSQHRRAADPSGFNLGCEVGIDHVRDEIAQHDEIDDVEEVSGCDE